jgi:hypothetical protein
MTFTIAKAPAGEAIFNDTSRVLSKQQTLVIFA